MVIKTVDIQQRIFFVDFEHVIVHSQVSAISALKPYLNSTKRQKWDFSQNSDHLPVQSQK